MDTNTFLSKLDAEKGLAPINRFVARIMMPGGIGSGAPAELSYLCDTAPIPGRTIATSELRHYGPTRKLAREATYPEFQLGFILTNAMSARKTFLNWMDFIIDPESANIRYQDEYKGTVEVLMFDQYSEVVSRDNAIAGAKYLEAFPTNVDPITLGWDQLNQVGKFSVNFAYKRWIDYKQTNPEMQEDSNFND
tara:strand:+ start:5333 stop:5911 length:579 start_codon:yes stop_codon:yes gene_type:complete